VPAKSFYEGALVFDGCSCKRLPYMRLDTLEKALALPRDDGPARCELDEAMRLKALAPDSSGAGTERLSWIAVSSAQVASSSCSSPQTASLHHLWVPSPAHKRRGSGAVGPARGPAGRLTRRQIVAASTRLRP